MTRGSLNADPAAVVAAALVAIFSARRLVLLAAASTARDPHEPPADDPPPLALVVPVHDEAPALEPLLGALDGIDYPPGRLRMVLVDDCSTDGSRDLLRAWVADRPHAELLELDHRAGKANALAAGLRAVPDAELVAFCDADVRPRPDSLRALVAPLGDPSVAAAAALLWPENADTGVVARYAALETWVHQLVTSRGKDRLDLNPPALGGLCAYRLPALHSVGGFRAGSRGEDVEATVALTRAGWRTRLAGRAVAQTRVAGSRSEYWTQHLRWGRAQLGAAAALGGGPASATTVASPQPPPGPVRWARRTEAALASAGYLDRLAFAAAAGLTLRGRLRPRWAAGYATVATSEIAATLAMAGSLRALPRYMAAAMALFPLDIAGAAIATGAELLRRPHQPWSTRAQSAARG